MMRKYGLYYVAQQIVSYSHSVVRQPGHYWELNTSVTLVLD